MTTSFATSISREQDSRQAGVQAARNALEKLGNDRPSLAVLFISSHFELEKVLAGTREILGPDTEIIGCSSSGEFTEEGCMNNAVAVALIASSEYSFRVRGRTGLKEDIRGVFNGFKEDFADFTVREGRTSALMMIDGLSGNGEECALSAIAAFETDMHISGGAAGDALAFEKTFVIAGDRVLTDGVALCMVKGPERFFSGVEHGHSPLSETLTATETRGNVLLMIDGRPAWEVWKEITREDAKTGGVDVDALKDASEIGSFLLKYELGLEAERGYKIRVPLSVNDDGSINFACTIPPEVSFRIMKSTQDDQVRSARKAAKLAKNAIGDRAIAGALIFDCVCRGLILGENRFCEAVDAMKEEIGAGVPLTGFETYGEICMDTRQFSGFHNTTSVVTLIPAT
jgi:methyl-accepting chemotaxis protein